MQFGGFLIRKLGSLLNVWVTIIINCGLVHSLANVAFRTKREKFSHKIEKVRFCKNV